MPKVSIVTPVYNAAQYLEECIVSLLRQTEPSCEFIFVNDGSTDESRSIIEKYQSDNRVKLINQPNAGVSAARNAGVQMASGEFLGFLDGDDTIEPDMMATLCELASSTRSDIVCSGFMYEQDGHMRKLDLPFEKNTPFGRDRIQSEVLPYMLRYDLMNSVANKIYRRSVIAENGITFPEGQALGEDAIFNLRAICASRQIVFTGYAGYFYRETTGSATRNLLKQNYFGAALKVFEFDYKKILSDRIPRDEIQRMKELRLVDQTMSYIALYAKHNGEVSASERFDYISKMISHPKIQELVRKHWQTLSQGQNRFGKIVLYCIKYRRVRLLWLMYAYSNFRNRK